MSNYLENKQNLNYQSKILTLWRFSLGQGKNSYFWLKYGKMVSSSFSSSKKVNQQFIVNGIIS